MCSTQPHAGTHLPVVGDRGDAQAHARAPPVGGAAGAVGVGLVEAGEQRRDRREQPRPARRPRRLPPGRRSVQRRARREPVGAGGRDRRAAQRGDLALEVGVARAEGGGLGAALLQRRAQPLERRVVRHAPLDQRLLLRERRLEHGVARERGGLELGQRALEDREVPACSPGLAARFCELPLHPHRRAARRQSRAAAADRGRIFRPRRQRAGRRLAQAGRVAEGAVRLGVRLPHPVAHARRGARASAALVDAGKTAEGQILPGTHLDAARAASCSISSRCCAKDLPLRMRRSRQTTEGQLEICKRESGRSADPAG